ncbi:MAG: NnrU family protein [Pseudomonadota bacterium]
MTLLITGLVLFLGIHSIGIVANARRDQLAKSLGPLGWRALYSIVAIVGFVLIIKGYAAARLDPTVLWYPPRWTSHVTAVLMLPVFVFLLAAYLPGRIKDALKHPMLVATKIWALAHLFANGTLADVLLFGGFLVWAVADRISLKRRVARTTVSLPKTGANDVIAVIGGLALYGGFVAYLHKALIGVAPFG